MEWEDMMKSPLFDYYHIHEADMLSRIYHDKNEHGHKITSQKMFAAEVAIMTDAIKHLNSIGIYVLYVYDALLCEEKDKAVVIETMNRIVLEHGVKTTIKDDSSAKIGIDSAIADEADDEESIAEENDTKRITVEDYFKRFKRKHGSYITDFDFNIHYNVLSKHYTFIDEIPEEHKSKCTVETLIDGVYGKMNLFK